MRSSEVLAWYRWPEPDGTDYYEPDLQDPEKVERIFDYCQILLASITRSGWRFLIKTYGYAGLVAINQKSGWFDEYDHEEAIGEIRRQCLLSGYDPDKDQFGVYDPRTGVFTPEQANS